jgi:hypothetical protein
VIVDKFTQTYRVPGERMFLHLKQLMVLTLIALLCFGVASVSWAQDAAASGQAVGAEPRRSLPQKMRKPKPMKNPRKGREGKTPTPARR